MPRSGQKVRAYNNPSRLNVAFSNWFRFPDLSIPMVLEND